MVEEPVLQSSFSTAEYAQIEGNFNSITDHIDILCEYIQEKIIPYINKGNFLDIGAGPGFITHKLFGHFHKTIALDPNNCYASYYSNSETHNKLRFINKNFRSTNFSRKFNFILCSHVLYHVPQSQWPIFIKKTLKLLAKKGRALFTLVALRGEFHDLCEQINHNYSNSQVLKSILKEIGVQYKTSKVISSYFHKEMQELINLLRMFVIDDCFLPEEYAGLPGWKIKAIDQKIVKFVEDCYNHTKNIYSFQIEEDYVQLQAD